MGAEELFIAIVYAAGPNVEFTIKITQAIAGSADLPFLWSAGERFVAVESVLFGAKRMIFFLKNCFFRN